MTDGFLISEDRELPFPVKQPMMVDKPQALTQLRFQPSMVGFAWRAGCLDEPSSQIVWECSKDECHFVAQFGTNNEGHDHEVLNETTLQLAQSPKKLKDDVGGEVALRFALAASVAEMRDIIETACRRFRCRRTVAGWDDALNLALVRKGSWKRGSIGAVKGRQAGRIEFELGEKLSGILECSTDPGRTLECIATVRRGRDELRLEPKGDTAGDKTLLLPDGTLTFFPANAVQISQAQLELQ